MAAASDLLYTVAHPKDATAANPPIRFRLSPPADQPVTMPKLRQFLRPAALLWLAGAVTTLAADPREVWDGQSRPWLASVGKLTVPGTRIEDGYNRHYIEDCSATLVRSPGAASADVIVTAWHCLADYRDLSKPILFTLRAGGGAGGAPRPGALVACAQQLTSV